jgi:hypothetical protein
LELAPADNQLESAPNKLLGSYKVFMKASFRFQNRNFGSSKVKAARKRSTGSAEEQQRVN